MSNAVKGGRRSGGVTGGSGRGWGVVEGHRWVQVRGSKGMPQAISRLDMHFSLHFVTVLFRYLLLTSARMNAENLFLPEFTSDETVTQQMTSK